MSTGNSLKSIFNKAADRMSYFGFLLGDLAGYGIAAAVGVPLGGALSVGLVAALPCAGIMIGSGLAVSFAAAKLFPKGKAAKVKNNLQPK